MTVKIQEGPDPDTPQGGNLWILGGAFLFLIGGATEAMMGMRGRASQPASWLLMGVGLLSITAGVAKNGASWQRILAGWLILGGLLALALYKMRGL